MALVVKCEGCGVEIEANDFQLEPFNKFSEIEGWCYVCVCGYPVKIPGPYLQHTLRAICDRNNRVQSSKFCNMRHYLGTQAGAAAAAPEVVPYVPQNISNGNTIEPVYGEPSNYHSP